MGTPFFALHGITKYFSMVVANRDVSFDIERGQVLALLGENGAGKSTVMKILYGLYRADSGRILMDGEERRIASPRAAIALGISMIQQHFSLVMAHTVAENIMLGNVRGMLDQRACEDAIRSMSDSYGFNIDPRALVGDLTVGERQKVEILKALYLDAKLLIMDEPTAVLTPRESDTLMEFVRGFVDRGNAVAFITHKLKEVMDVADRVVVMRDGMVCGNVAKADTNEKELARLMIGRDIAAVEAGGAARDQGEVCLALNKVTVRRQGVTCLDELSLRLHKGEILGIAGVAGNGQRELCETVCGMIRPVSGTLELCGRDVTQGTVRDRVEQGIGYVPSDRHRDGMIVDMSVAENMMLKSHSDGKWLKSGLFIDAEALEAYAREAIAGYNIKAPGPRALAGGLSGGNQQKVVVAREVDCGRLIIVFDQPTRGLDLGAIDHVHRTILREKAAGKAILLISTELSELFALADRIAVLYKGRIQGIGRREDMDTETIGLMMAGYAGKAEAAA